MRKLSLILVFIGFSVLAYGQRTGQQYDQEKLESARVAFITNRLDLKPAQAEKFWPLYNLYREDRMKMMEEMSSLNRDANKELADERALAIIGQRFEIQEKMLAKEKQFMKDIQEVITPSQAVKLGSVNRDFTRQVYRMQQGRTRGGGGKN
ncbi:Spy/CpxP family protein refolding chaperone [Cecembia sp.]|uniref:Spy/CpxP family protein refolding chaperone n=1 Tax=Cecembia sp. TaxID=1898110 RepID=UPI0025C3154C|nr:Spy/CpxP family protein refolding chaperone [Cecembia sp.]